MAGQKQDYKARVAAKKTKEIIAVADSTDSTVVLLLGAFGVRQRCEAFLTDFSTCMCAVI